MPEYIKYKLPNGLTVVLQSVESSVSISAGLWIKTGSRNETYEQYGYAHFLEHMLFKGTDKYSAKEIAQIVDRVGGQHNAATNREYTCYYINVVADYLDLSLELLSNMYYKSAFDPEEIEREKNVVIEEIRMYEDAPDELVHDVFMEEFFSGHPLGHTILGTEKHIKSISRDSIYDFYNQSYITENSILVIVGKFEIENVKNIITKYYSEPRTTVSPLIKPVSNFKRNYRKHIKKKLEQVHYCIGFDGITKEDDDRWALYLLSTILGGSMSSRLFQKVREKEGLCYSVYSFHSSYIDKGIFGIYCGTSPDKFDKSLSLILQECKDILSNNITETELNDAKTFMKGNIALGLESIETRMGQIARNELFYDKYYSFDDVINSIYKVSLEDFKRVTDKIFTDNRATLVTIGNLKKKYEKEIIIA